MKKADGKDCSQQTGPSSVILRGRGKQGTGAASSPSVRSGYLNISENQPDWKDTIVVTTSHRPRNDSGKKSLRFL